MKMPMARYFPPLNLPEFDRFGLPNRWGGFLELEDRRKDRIAAVEKLVADVFNRAAMHLGEEEARRLFARAAPRRKRGKRKSHVPDRDAQLLLAYDTAALKGETIVSIARRLHADRRGEFGASIGAIERQIHKLLKEQKQRNHAAAVQNRVCRMANRHMPPGLLGI